MKPSTALPAPVGGGAVLESPELQQLAQKARGPWKELTKEEVVQRESKHNLLQVSFICIKQKYWFCIVEIVMVVLFNAHLHTQ